MQLLLIFLLEQQQRLENLEKCTSIYFEEISKDKIENITAKIQALIQKNESSHNKLYRIACNCAKAVSWGMIISIVVATGIRQVRDLPLRPVQDLTLIYSCAAAICLVVNSIFEPKGIKDPEVIKKINAAVILELEKDASLKKIREGLRQWSEKKEEHFNEVKNISKKISDFSKENSMYFFDWEADGDAEKSCVSEKGLPSNEKKNELPGFETQEKITLKNKSLEVTTVQKISDEDEKLLSEIEKRLSVLRKNISSRELLLLKVDKRVKAILLSQVE